jgi:flagellar assembly protein FliH
MPKPAVPNRGTPFRRQTGADPPPRGGESDRSAQAAVLPELALGAAARLPRAGADADLGDQHPLREAEREAQALLEAARQKSVRLTQEAVRDGRLQGQAEGLAQAHVTIEGLIRTLSAAAALLQTQEEEFRVQARTAIVELALAVAGRICRAATAQDPTAILETVTGALAALPEPGEITVRIHPDHLAILQDHRLGLIGTLGESSALRFVADPGVEPGGCLVEAAGGLVDATVSGQLDEARRRLLREAG